MKWIRLTAVNLFLLILLVLILELLVRLIGGERINYQGSSRNIFQDSLYFDTFGLRAGAEGTVFGAEVHINHLGFRGPEIQLDSAKLKMLLIGDSVLFGVGVADSQTTRYYLQKFFEDSILFVNTANIGYGLYDYQNIIRYWKIKINPKKILLFYVLNDLYSASVDLQGGSRFWYEPLLQPLRTRSKLYLWIKNGVLDRGKSFFLYDYQLYNPQNSLFRSASKLIMQISEQCHEDNIQLIVYVLPYRYQYLEKTEDPWRPQNLIISQWKEYHVNVYDTRGAFPADNIDDYFLYGDPMHLSDTGHQALANYVRQTLKDSE